MEFEYKQKFSNTTVFTNFDEKLINSKINVSDSKKIENSNKEEKIDVKKITKVEKNNLFFQMNPEKKNHEFLFPSLPKEKLKVEDSSYNFKVFSEKKNKNFLFLNSGNKEKNELNELRMLIGLRPIVKRESIEEKKKKINEVEIKKKTIYERGFNKQNRKKRFKLKFFYDLCFILNKIFLGGKPKISSFNLCPLKEEILFLILFQKYKKFLTKKMIVKMEKEELLQKKITFFLNLIDSQDFKISRKRAEENMKFIFNMTLKKLKRKFFHIKNLKNNFKNEKHFHSFYFENENNNKILEKIIFIKSKNSKHHFNKKDLAIYFMSETFKKDFQIYLNQNFKQIYLKYMTKKWENFFKRYEKDCNNFNKCTKKIINQIKISKRFKLPWNMYEVEHAILSFNALMSKL